MPDMEEVNMLSNPELFTTVESACYEKGIIERFEKENGKVKGRMMIDGIDLPNDIPLYPNADNNSIAFEASFDFMDIKIGFVFSVDKIEAASNLWYHGSKDGNSPDNVWVELFVKTIVESIEPDGSYGIPIYVFISDTGSFSIVPTRPDDIVQKI